MRDTILERLKLGSYPEGKADIAKMFDQTTLQNGDESHTRTFIDQSQVKNSAVETDELEDDVMNEEEYKTMMDRKRQVIRFSNAQKLDRRSTIFDPSDPNNASSAIKFLSKLPLRQRAMTKAPIAASGRSPG